MPSATARCVPLADRHHGLTEGVRCLLEPLFDPVVLVADEGSLLETAFRLQPTLAVADLSLSGADGPNWVRRLRDRCPAMGVILLIVHDESSIRRAALLAGANAVVFEHTLANELMPTVEAVLACGGAVPHDPDAVAAISHPGTPSSNV
jgi:two-component system nitrate/nitrite response regulator NarL